MVAPGASGARRARAAWGKRVIFLAIIQAAIVGFAVGDYLYSGSVVLAGFAVFMLLVFVMTFASALRGHA